MGFHPACELLPFFIDDGCGGIRETNLSETTNVRVAVDVRCELGEGPLWHPKRGRLLWFDIKGQTLFEASVDGGGLRAFGFGEPVSAAGWIDATDIVVASATGLQRLNLETGARTTIASLEAANPLTRSNDGRVGPGGAFWIGTMGLKTEAGAGALYRFADGKFEILRTGMTVPNSIAFSPDRRRAYFSDTREKRIMVFSLDAETGAPTGNADIFVDLAAEGLKPDGAVVDAAGYLWSAQWGSGRVARYGPDGVFDRAVDLPVSQPTCPAFGGPDLKTLFVTSAWQGFDATARDAEPLAGAVFAIDVDAAGQREHAFIG